MQFMVWSSVYYVFFPVRLPSRFGSELLILLINIHFLISAARHKQNRLIIIRLGEAVVQWLAFGYANLGPWFESRYPLTNFLQYYRRVSKDYSNCCRLQTGLTMLYTFEVVATIASLALNIKRECRKSRRHYKKSKPAPLTGRWPSTLASMKPIGTTCI